MYPPQSTKYAEQESHPFTTEEPIHTNTRRDSLELELAHLNALDQTPPSHVPFATMKKCPNPNGFSPPSPDDEQAFLTQAFSTRENDRACYEEEEELLLRTTEANKHIPYTQDMDFSDSSSFTTSQPEIAETLVTTESDRDGSRASAKERQRIQNLLVFSEPPSFIESYDRCIVTTVYGAGPTGTSILNQTQCNGARRPSRAYMVACDFSDDSYQAMEWVMGTMMRDGDELHVVAAMNREENPEAVKKAGLSVKSELKVGSDKVTLMAKKALGQMLLYNIKLSTYTIVGRIKDVLYSTILQLPLTLVICGSRGRGSVKGFLMGSISSFLVHKSPVPVSVIRKMPKINKEGNLSKKRAKIKSPPLPENKTDGIVVDEVEMASKPVLKR